MVKVYEKYNKPGGIVFFPGETYIGDSRALGLAVFLDHGYSTKVLLRFKDQKLKTIEFNEFYRAVEYIEAFSTGQIASYESPDPEPTRISMVLLENSRILLRWEESSTVLLPLDFFQTLNVLLAIRKKLGSIVRQRLERKALLQDNGLMETLKKWGGLLVFAALAVLNLFLLVGFFIWPHLFIHWLALTVFMALWLLVKPQWAGRVIPNTLLYLNEGLLTDLANLHFPKKSAEIFIILITIISFYLYFGSEAANFILNFYKGSSLP